MEVKKEGYVPEFSPEHEYAINPLLVRREDESDVLKNLHDRNYSWKDNKELLSSFSPSEDYDEDCWVLFIKKDKTISFSFLSQYERNKEPYQEEVLSQNYDWDYVRPIVVDEWGNPVVRPESVY